MVQGRYKSIMAVVTACRSDMSVNGLAPEAHLADGRLQLVLVRDTSRFHYLRFMASIPRCGALLFYFFLARLKCPLLYFIGCGAGHEARLVNRCVCPASCQVLWADWLYLAMIGDTPNMPRRPHRQSADDGHFCFC